MKNLIIGYEIINDDIIVEFSNNKKTIKYTKENEKEILNTIENQKSMNSILINKYRNISNIMLILILLITAITIISMFTIGFKIAIFLIGIFMFIIVIDSYISSKYDNLIKALEFSEKNIKV